MAAVTWTEEQKQVIDHRGGNLLVSAAAGSGKTAVLVERIIQMITDPEAPVDIDHLLVMTFTRMAASEMRERISEAIEKRLEENPGDQNLERQSTLIHNAKIMTIDSFCLNLLREYFNELDLDPGFRIADEGELLLLQEDVMQAMMEEHYAENDPDFYHFVDTYASGKTDQGLEEYILKIYRVAQSTPWPEEWFEAQCKDAESCVDAADGMDPDKLDFMEIIRQDVRDTAKSCANLMESAKEVAEEEEGLNPYLPVLEDEIRMLEELEAASSYQEIHKALREFQFVRIPSAKRGTDPAKKEYASSIRKQVKDSVEKMVKRYAPGDYEETLNNLLEGQLPALLLLRLAHEFTIRFEAARREKNIIDFSDMEHYALQILTAGSPDHSPGPAAEELSEYFEEILVDEYQDSNLVQETLVNLISKERHGKPDVFMVGDVKQSIYKFRLAKPELFIEKYDTYEESEDCAHRKIELHRNFRSRPEVLRSVNDLFYGIMTKSLGDIEYTDKAALYPGASYPEPGDDWNVTELMLLNSAELYSSGRDTEQADYSQKEAEARMIAAEIRKITDPETGKKIWNSRTNQYEPLKRRDIVILLRSLAGWTEEFVKVLTSEGIAAYAESGTGYFSTIEVETVLNMLALIDNPMQDIPLAGVLHSPIGGVSDRELAIVMAKMKEQPEKGEDRGLYGAIRYYLGLELQDEISEKLLRFLQMIRDFREEAEYLPVSGLLYRIFDRTGYYDYVSAMPAGQVRRANLDMLVVKASAYEKTSYSSLFDFIRYIEKLKKYETDFGEASTVSEDEDTVRIMSIHKSKGLEFPVVFLAGAGKRFNHMDSMGKILFDSDYGVAVDFIDESIGARTTTIKKNALSRRIVLETMAEELRVLYVAMTRAKEKLYITAADRYLLKHLDTRTQSDPGEAALPYVSLTSAGSCLDWLLMSLSRTAGSIRMRVVPLSEVFENTVAGEVKALETGLFLRSLREAEEEEFTGNPLYEETRSMLLSQYPFPEDLSLHAKVSVSELKHQAIFQDDEESDYLPSVPRFLRDEEEKTENGGAARGTAYHRVLELIDFKEADTLEQVTAQMESMEEKELMSAEDLEKVDPRSIFTFLCSPLAQRMKKADEKGLLKKEQQFVVGIPARDLGMADSGELVLMQGIIDAYFEEEDGLVIVDYKTDRIKPGEEEVLFSRYEVQMQCYHRALTQLTEKNVKEVTLYSLRLQEEIRVI